MYFLLPTLKGFLRVAGIEIKIPFTVIKTAHKKGKLRLQLHLKPLRTAPHP